jgi:hypothetical protein
VLGAATGIVAMRIGAATGIVGAGVGTATVIVASGIVGATGVGTASAVRAAVTFPAWTARRLSRHESGKYNDRAD